MDQIRIIATGGTFDKQYDEISGELTFTQSHLPQIMKQIRCSADYDITFLPLKDSLYMDDSDRKRLYQTSLEAPESRIIIIHGTDTMTLSAEYLNSRQLKGKSIVFTGAMVPYTVSGSDALFNLGTAFSAVQLLDEGIYICMNGNLFESGKVRKNRSLGLFEPLA
jgi:L-asparaginase